MPDSRDQTGNPDDEFYIIDVRPAWRDRPYITVWRPDNKGYAYPLPWAGIYKRSELQLGYHADKGGTKLFERFPVPRAAVERLGVKPRRGVIDGDVGPVLPNDAKTRRALRAARVIPERANG